MTLMSSKSFKLIFLLGTRRFSQASPFSSSSSIASLMIFGSYFFRPFLPFAGTSKHTAEQSS